MPVFNSTISFCQQTKPLSRFFLHRLIRFITGSIVGRIYNSPTYVDGDVVWTSPITKGNVKENEEVSTESGSKYFLSSAPLEDTTKQADIAKAKSTTSPPPQKTATMRTTPENLAAALKEISGAVSELESSLKLGLEGASPSKTSSSKSKIDVVLGAQWGDEGKGKLVDMLSQVSKQTKLVFLMPFMCIWNALPIEFRIKKMNKLSRLNSAVNSLTNRPTNQNHLFPSVRFL